MARVWGKPRSWNRGHRKNDACNFSTTLPTKSNSTITVNILHKWLLTEQEQKNKQKRQMDL